jgi:Putative Ig domain
MHWGGQGGARMGLPAIDPDSSTNGALDTRRGLSEIHANNPGDMARAVAALLQNKFLTHTFGVHGEWEVRTTLVTSRQAWRYHSSVFVHGRESRRHFPPIDVDRTRQIRQAGAATEEMQAAFAREAVAVHSARCASVAEYILLSSTFSHPQPRQRGAKRLALVLLSITVLLTAYWFWQGSKNVGPEQPYQKPWSHSIRWQPPQVSYHHPAGEPFVFSLPTLERTPNGVPVEVTYETSGDMPGWLQFDRKQLLIKGTSPLTAEDQTYRLIIRAHAEQGSDSELLILLTIIGQPSRIPPTPQLRHHWTW